MTSTTLQNVPLELLDMILMKAVAKLVMSTWDDAGYKIQTSAYKHLATVWSEWYNRLTTRWFQIVLQRELKRFNPLAKYREKPELVKQIDMGRSVWGLAILDKELFVASIDDMAIHVFDPVAFTRLRIIQVEGNHGPRDIAACQLNKCLYLVDLVWNTLVLCVNRKGKILRKWQIPYESRNISVTPSGNILMTLISGLLIYGSDGTVLQEIKYDTDELDVLWQTILLKSGNHLVCQGWYSSMYHRVLRLTPEGTIIKSFGNEKQHSESHLADPVFMAVDKDELIYVADSLNNRVVLLNQALLFMKEIVSEKDGVIQPYRVLMDDASGFFFVGTNDSQLLIFNLFK